MVSAERLHTAASSRITTSPETVNKLVNVREETLMDAQKVELEYTPPLSDCVWQVRQMRIERASQLQNSPLKCMPLVCVCIGECVIV
jgi:hypothetical protein